MSLHHLLKRKEITTLLQEFCGLMPPNTKLALIRSGGRFFAGTGEWNEAELAQIAIYLDHVSRDAYTPKQITDLRIYPLLVDDNFVGVLVTSGSILETIIRCLHLSLTLLLSQAQEKRDVTHEALERYREINLLYGIAESIGATLDIEAIPELVLTKATQVIRADIGKVLLPASENKTMLEIKSSFGCDGLEHDVIHYAIDQVYEAGTPEIFTALSLASSQIDTVVCVPLKMRDRVLGVIMLGRLVKKPVFTAGDEKLLMALASQTAIAIDKAWLHKREIKRQRLDKELAVGQQIQLSLLPESTPIISGWDFAAIYQSAWQVGGDFYDIFELPSEPDKPHRLGMLIADVTGKGVPAALFMAFSRSIIRTTSMNGRNPAFVLEQANRLIVQGNRSGIYLTAFYAILEIETGRLTYASAGHNWPFWLPADKTECQELDAEGFLLGAFEDITLEEREIQIADGDVLVFFTDGVPEAMNAKKEMFCEERLDEAVVTHAEGTAEEILQAIVNTVKDFTGDTPQSDDFTLFVVKRSASNG
jgi:serine phosphatase RsbU (regulator of sigma subunit)